MTRSVEQIDADLRDCVVTRQTAQDQLDRMATIRRELVAIVRSANERMTVLLDERLDR